MLDKRTLIQFIVIVGEGVGGGANTLRNERNGVSWEELLQMVIPGESSEY